MSDCEKFKWVYQTHWIDVSPNFFTLGRYLKHDTLRPHGDESIAVGNTLHARNVGAVEATVVILFLAKSLRQ